MRASASNEPSGSHNANASRQKRTRNMHACANCAKAQIRCIMDPPFSRQSCKYCTQRRIPCPPHVPRKETRRNDQNQEQADEYDRILSQMPPPDGTLEEILNQWHQGP